MVSSSGAEAYDPDPVCTINIGVTILVILNDMVQVFREKRVTETCHVGRCVPLLYRKILKLGCSELLSLPDSVGQLVALHSLELGSNQLISLPESVGELVALQELRFTASN